MSLRVHLVDSHSAIAKHFAKCCGLHKTYSATLQDGPEKTLHDGLAKAFSDQADHHVKAAMECSSMDLGPSIATGDIHGPSKVLGDRDRFGKAGDDGVRGTIPSNPNVTAVPRTGAPNPDEDVSKVAGPHGHIFERQPQQQL
jgi:hypothetical protein